MQWFEAVEVIQPYVVRISTPRGIRDRLPGFKLQGEQEAYLVDGVAINGVSGGPAFYLDDSSPVVMGVVSAYVPNRATGEALPGVGVVRSVTQFHELAPTFASLDQAKEEETPATPPPPQPEVGDDGPIPSRRIT